MDNEDDKALVERLELAKVSLMSCEDIVSLTNKTTDLVKLQSELASDVINVNKIKDILAGSKPEEITLEGATKIDDVLNKYKEIENNENEQVTGVENLGYTLTPSMYISTRIAGCEGFIEESFKYTKRIISNITSMAQEKLTLMQTSHHTLTRQLDLLSKALDGRIIFREDKIELSSFHYRNLNINGEFPKSLPDELLRTAMTVSMITNNYYQYSLSFANKIMAFFGSLGTLTEDDARAKIPKIRELIKNNHFKDALFLNKELTNSECQVKDSVIVLGNKCFRSSKYTTEIKTLIASAIIENICSGDYLSEVSFVNKYAERFNESGVVKPLGMTSIKKIIANARKTISLNDKSFRDGERFLLSGQDYLDIVAIIGETDWSDDFKNEIHALFDYITSYITNEQLNLRSNCVVYLTLLLNSVIHLCERSFDGV